MSIIRLCLETASEPFKPRQRLLPYHLCLAGPETVPLKVYAVTIPPQAGPTTFRIEVWSEGAAPSGGLRLAVPGCADLRVHITTKDLTSG